VNRKTLQSRKKKTEDTVNVKDFNKTVHTLIELLGRDMESSNPSRDRDMLVAVRDGLFRVEVSGQLFDHVKSFRNLLIRHFPEAARIEFNKERHIEMSKTAAKLSIQPFAGKAQICDFLKEFGVDTNDTEVAIFAITQFIEMVRRLPMKFFTDPDNRLRLITNMQSELDELIVEEEAEQQEVGDEDDEEDE
jgi:hypothetical protein